MFDGFDDRRLFSVAVGSVAIRSDRVVMMSGDVFEAMGLNGFEIGLKRMTRRD